MEVGTSVVVNNPHRTLYGRVGIIVKVNDNQLYDYDVMFDGNFPVTGYNADELLVLP